MFRRRKGPWPALAVPIQVSHYPSGGSMFSFLSFRLRRWLNQEPRHSQRGRHGAGRKRRAWFAPTLEILEARTVPTALAWSGPASGGNWDTATNWTGGTLPGMND